MNPLESVRQTCSFVVENLVHLSISDECIESYASELSSQESKIGSVEWDETGWHYCSDAGSLGPMTAQYILVLDALNFCFWPVEGFEYDSLAISLKLVLEKDPTAFNADKLSSIDEVSHWYDNFG
jgi:hypothetical protein